MSGPGLPVKLPDETYSCFFEEVMGRFNISVPSVEVTAGVSYTCDITDQVASFDAVQVGMYTFIATSLVGVLSNGAMLEPSITLHGQSNISTGYLRLHYVCVKCQEVSLCTQAHCTMTVSLCHIVTLPVLLFY